MKLAKANEVEGHWMYVNMKLKDLLDLNKGSIISIVGAGGKSSLMYYLGEELRGQNKVLITTTTKIYLPKKEKYDYIAIGQKSLSSLKHNKNKGIYVYGSSINKENKIIGPTVLELDNECPYFDYILAESDGAKGKAIKGWNDTEPVISFKTDKTIGVLSLEVIGKNIEDDTVHRVEEFVNITNSKKNEKITLEKISSLVFHPRGLFKDSRGEKILFINKIESFHQNVLARKFLVLILEENHGYIDKIIIGSIKHKSFNLIFKL